MSAEPQLIRWLLESREHWKIKLWRTTEWFNAIVRRLCGGRPSYHIHRRVWIVPLNYRPHIPEQTFYVPSSQVTLADVFKHTTTGSESVLIPLWLSCKRCQILVKFRLKLPSEVLLLAVHLHQIWYMILREISKSVIILKYFWYVYDMGSENKRTPWHLDYQSWTFSHLLVQPLCLNKFHIFSLSFNDP